MEVHKEIIRDLCRLCGSRQKEGSSHRPKGDLGRLISGSLGIQLENDDDNVHPPNICTACRMKLHRWQVKKSKTKVVPEVNIKLFQFGNHSGETCFCLQSKWDVTMQESVLQVARNIGFYAWIKNNSVICCVLDGLGRHVLKRVAISEDAVSIEVLGKEVPATITSGFSPVREDLLRHVYASSVCEGNLGFDSICESGISFKDRSGNIVAEHTNVHFNGTDVVAGSCIRHHSCKLLLQGSVKVCDVCHEYRTILRTISSRKQRKEGEPSKYTRNDLLSAAELKQKATRLQAEKRSAQKKHETLKKRVAEIFQAESLDIDGEQADIVKSMVEECAPELESLLEENSFQKLLWEQQCQAAKARDKRAMRWHPAIIKWAVALHTKSSSAYDVLRKSQFLVLPHPNTLYRYTHFTQPDTGLNQEYLFRMYEDKKISELKEHERIISLMFDEMKIKAGLVFSRGNGKLVGFTSVSDISGELESFEKRLHESTEEEDLASHVLLFMARGITSNLKFPVAYYATSNVTGAELYPLVWECVWGLSLIGLTVKCIVADGATNNRKVYRILSASKEKPQGEETGHSSKNVFTKSAKLYFLCDTPHLIKTTRNNFENSNFNRKTKNLRFRSKDIQWTHLLSLQGMDQGSSRLTPGLRLVPKLTHEHLHLTPSLRMKVSLAAQVLSKTVADALEMMKQPGFSSTIFFIRQFNKFFDCLNVSRFSQGVKTRNEDLLPYTSADDKRLKWLVDDFLGFLTEWKEEIDGLKDITPTERKRLCLSDATQTGIKITVQSFVAVAKEMLSMEGVNFLLSDKLNQDPVEEFFGKQRGAGGFHDNPTLDQFGHHFLRNVVAGSFSRGSIRGNVQLSSEQEQIGDEPLPKKKRVGTTLK